MSGIDGARDLFAKDTTISLVTPGQIFLSFIHRLEPKQLRTTQKVWMSGKMRDVLHVQAAVPANAELRSKGRNFPKMFPQVVQPQYLPILGSQQCYSTMKDFTTYTLVQWRSSSVLIYKVLLQSDLDEWTHRINVDFTSK